MIEDNICWFKFQSVSYQAVAECLITKLLDNTMLQVKFEIEH